LIDIFFVETKRVLCWVVGFCCLKDCWGLFLLLLLPGLNTKSENGIEAGRVWIWFGP